MIEYLYNTVFYQNEYLLKKPKWKPRLYTIYEENEYCESNEFLLTEQKYILTKEYLKIIITLLQEKMNENSSTTLRQFLESLDIQLSNEQFDFINNNTLLDNYKEEIISNYNKVFTNFSDTELQYIKDFLLKLDTKMMLLIIDSLVKSNKTNLKNLISNY